MKKILLSFLTMITCLPLWAQRDIKKEILIYFGNGVSWETKLVNGLPTHVVQVKKESLKQSLLELDILESDLIVADPDFNLADTIHVLPDGKVLQRINWSKFYIYTVKAHQNLQDMILELEKLPEVLTAARNYIETVPDGGLSNGVGTPFSSPITSRGLFLPQALSLANKPITDRKQEEYKNMPPKGQVEILLPGQEKLPVIEKVSRAAAERKVAVYPNPAREKLRLELIRPGKEEPDFSRLELYNALSGKKVWSAAVQEALNKPGLTKPGTMEVDVQGLPRGLYHLRLIPASQKGEKGQAFRIILE